MYLYSCNKKTKDDHQWLHGIWQFSDTGYKWSSLEGIYTYRNMKSSTYLHVALSFQKKDYVKNIYNIHHKPVSSHF
jgi:hypothetical protein